MQVLTQVSYSNTLPRVSPTHIQNNNHVAQPIPFRSAAPIAFSTVHVHVLCVPILKAIGAAEWNGVGTHVAMHFDLRRSPAPYINSCNSRAVGRTRRSGGQDFDHSELSWTKCYHCMQRRR